MEQMTAELSALVWVTGATLLMWFPYILCRLGTYGVIPSVMYRHDSEPVAGWAERAKKAHYNAIENLIPFAVLVLVAHLMGISNAATGAAATVFLWARIAHYFLYVANVPFGRTITFAIGWFAMACIFYHIVVA